jgi:hypothetical protein
MSGREEFEREKIPPKQGEPQAPKEAYAVKESFGGGGSKLPPSPARSPETSPDYSEDIDTSLRQVTIHINSADWPDSPNSEGKGLAYVSARQTEVGYCSVTLKLDLSVREDQLKVYIEADAKVGGHTLDYQAASKLFDLSQKHTFNVTIHPLRSTFNHSVLSISI